MNFYQINAKNKFIPRAAIAVIIAAVFGFAYLNDHKTPSGGTDAPDQEAREQPPALTDFQNNIGTTEGDGKAAPLLETEIGAANNPVSSPTPPEAGRIAGKVCFGEQCYGVELARTSQEIERGLMYRSSLDKDKGMLFDFGTAGIHKFWMKNTLISLDMVWIGADKKIIFISNNISPCIKNTCPLYGPDLPARYVLEVNGGEMKRLTAKVGDAVAIE
ncbi:MAG: DUF192 domain-containing protein [Minisyncoccales bacterium]